MAVTWRLVGDNIIFLAAVLGALALLYKYGAGMVRWVGGQFNSELTDRVEIAVINANKPVLTELVRIEQRLEVVESEVTANGGSLKGLIVKDRIEFRDRLDRVESELHQTRSIVDVHVREAHP